jgi:hypothetical protein
MLGSIIYISYVQLLLMSLRAQAAYVVCTTIANVDAVTTTSAYTARYVLQQSTEASV